MGRRLIPVRHRRRAHPMVRPMGLDRLRGLDRGARPRNAARGVACRGGVARGAASLRDGPPAVFSSHHTDDSTGLVRGSSAAGEHGRTDELARLEAVLFLAREPLNTRRLARLARLADGTRARVLLRELNRLLDDAGSAFRVEAVAGGFQLLSRAAFGPWLRRLLDAQPQTRLSSPAMETLAIVAYRQPVSRAEIESIRGVGCEEMLRQLLDRDLVAIGGRSEEIGRPNLYVTTRNFMRCFGLGRLEDLPPIPGGDAPAPPS